MLKIPYSVKTGKCISLKPIISTNAEVVTRGEIYLLGCAAAISMKIPRPRAVHGTAAATGGSSRPVTSPFVPGHNHSPFDVGKNY
jgi:hypothetical protein